METFSNLANTKLPSAEAYGGILSYWYTFINGEMIGEIIDSTDTWHPEQTCQRP